MKTKFGLLFVLMMLGTPVLSAASFFFGFGVAPRPYRYLAPPPVYFAPRPPVVYYRPAPRYYYVPRGFYRRY